MPIYSVKAHKEIINAIDGVGGLGIGEGAPEIVTASRDGWLDFCQEHDQYYQINYINRSSMKVRSKFGILGKTSRPLPSLSRLRMRRNETLGPPVSVSGRLFRTLSLLAGVNGLFISHRSRLQCP